MKRYFICGLFNHVWREVGRWEYEGFLLGVTLLQSNCKVAVIDAAEVEAVA